MCAAAQPPPRVTTPRVISKEEPSYSEEARRAKVNATASVRFYVNQDGMPEDISIVRPAGFGLDQEAVRAVSGWRFEPATRDGAPVRQVAIVEVNWKLLDEARNGETARLLIQTRPRSGKPELRSGVMPPKHDSAPHFVSVQFGISPEGRTENPVVLEADDAKWASSILRELGKWRFTPGAGPVSATLEISTGSARASGQLVEVTGGVQDSSLPAPSLIEPDDRAHLTGFPRLLNTAWQPVPGARSYLVEWDYAEPGGWHSEVYQAPGLARPTPSASLTITFVGDQRGRWRVWPVGAKGRGNPSEWRTFDFSNR